LRLALDDNLRFALDTPKYVNRPEPNAVDLIEANVIEYVEPYFTQWAFEAMKNRTENTIMRKLTNGFEGERAGSYTAENRAKSAILDKT